MPPHPPPPASSKLYVIILRRHGMRVNRTWLAGMGSHTHLTNSRATSTKHSFHTRTRIWYIRLLLHVTLRYNVLHRSMLT